MWSGRATIGDFFAVYEGGTDQNSAHAHVAVQLALGLDADVAVRWADGTCRAPGILIRPLVEHRVEPGPGEVRFLYVEPRAPLGRALLGGLGGRDVQALPDEAPWHALVDGGPAHLVPRLESALGVGRSTSLDPRLERALARLEEDDGGPGAVGRAAREADVSPSRLRVLARQQLGAPLSRWLLWRKLERALRAVAAGRPLADAAGAGGFSDQAHLARTMRRMFGITPGEAVHTLR